MKGQVMRILGHSRMVLGKWNLRKVPKLLLSRANIFAIVLLSIVLMMSTVSPLFNSKTSNAAETVAYPASVQASPSSIIESISSQDKATFMYFYADWCHVCQEEKPIIDKLEQEYAQQIAFVRVNSADSSELMNEFGVTGFPSMFLVSDQTRKEFRGFTTEEMLRENFEQATTGGSSAIADSSSSLTGTTGYAPIYSCSSSDPDVQAKFNWSMPERFGDFDGDGMLDYRKTLESIDPNHWRVNFNASWSTNSTGLTDCSGMGGPMDYYWFVNGAPVGSTRGCNIHNPFHYDFPSEGAYQVTLAVVDGHNCDMVTKEVIVQDWLIVGVGDSYASGEGNPDISVEDAFNQAQAALEELAEAAASAQEAFDDLQIALNNFTLLPDWEYQPFEQQLAEIQAKLQPALTALDAWKHWCVDEAPWTPVECADATATLTVKLTELGLEAAANMIAQGYDYIQDKIEAIYDTGEAALNWAQQMNNLGQAVVNAAESLEDYKNTVWQLIYDSRKVTRTQEELDQLNQDLAELQQNWNDFQTAVSDVTQPLQDATDQLQVIQDRIQPALNALNAWQQACTNDSLSEDCLLPSALINQLQNLGFVNPIDFITLGYEYIRSRMQALVDVNQVALDRAEAWGDAVRSAVSTAQAAAVLIPQVAEVLQALLDDLVNEPWAVWQDLQCKRSAFSGQAQAALAIEEADPHTSVTFVHLACSGGTINKGLIGPYKGAVPDAGDMLDPQIDVVRSLVGDRQIDALLVSIGGNDLGFGPIVFSAIPLEPSCGDNPQPDPLIQSAIETVCLDVGDECSLLSPFLPIDCTNICTTYLESLLTGGETAKQIYEGNITKLEGYYEALQNELVLKLPGLLANRVYLTEYPTPARDDDGTTYCGWDVNDPLKMLPGLSQEEVEWAETTVVANLNEAVGNATDKWGWNYVAGNYDDYLTHGYCADDHYVGRLYESFLIQRDEGGTLHPNKAGHLVYRDNIVDALLPHLYPYGANSPARVPFDADRDGIGDSVDGQIIGGNFTGEELVFSDNFTDQHLDGASYGDISERNGLKVQVEDGYITEGFLITATGDEGPVAEVSVCDLMLHLTNGDEVVATCGSLTLEVLSGPVEIVLDGITVTVPSDTTVIITEVTPGNFRIENSADSDSQEPVTINMRGTMIYLDRGEILDVPKIAITKVTVDGATSGDGLNILAGESISWKYTLTNTGIVALSSVSVTDSESVSVICPKTALDVGDSMECTATGTAIPGNYSNTGNATGSFTDFKVPTTATATDDSSYFGADPQIGITKVTVDGLTEGDGLNILTGESIAWKFIVANVGNVPLSNVVVTDSQLGTVCTIPTLNVGESTTCTVTGTAGSGSHSNTGNATGSYTDSAGHSRSDTESDASYYFGANPQIDIAKTTDDGYNEGDGLSIVVGQPITWRYTLTNTGNVALSNIVVSDSQVGVNPVYVSGDTNIDGKLDLTETWIYEATGTAILGNYSNTGTASGSYTDSAGHTRTDTETDGSSYVGIPKGAVTSSSLCEFDVTSDPEQQFRLIFTPEMQATVFKLNASNPGQFYYNAFFYASSPGSMNITIPYPFVTQGATPVHVYSGVTATYSDLYDRFCFTPGTEVSSETDQIVLGGGYDSFGDATTITVDFPNTGLVYVAVHLDYGLKKTSPYTKNLADPANPKADGAIDIVNNQRYDFSDTKSGADTIYSLNEFKKDPGIGGLVLQSGTGDPVAGATVEIWLGSKKMAMVKTDADGWYMWNYKYTGKAATFTVKLPTYGLSQTATLKSNSFLVVNFTVP